MAYRSIPRPANIASLNTPTRWIEWADDENLLPSVAPKVDATCGLCHGAVGVTADGEPHLRCFRCLKYGELLSVVVPIIYSMDSGLESLLHQYKDWGPEYRWMAYPLASVLWEFLSEHLKCIEKHIGSIDIVSMVPKGNDTREFDHIDLIRTVMNEWPMSWDDSLLLKVKKGAPDVGAVEPSFYALATDKSVEGLTVLLIDDTWTSGATIASAAKCLKDAGARSIAAVTIGRQLKVGFGSANQVLEVIQGRKFSNDRCVLCG